VHVLDDPRVSDRLQRLLASEARRVASTGEDPIRSTASLQIDDHRQPAPAALITAMVDFERR
jgi:hypothetical protein